MKALLKQVANRRLMIMYHFLKVGKYLKDNIVVAPSGPVTRSMANDNEDNWVIDMDAATCNMAQTRRLDRYPIDHVLTLPRNTKLLLLVSIVDDMQLLLNRGAKVNTEQQLPTRVIRVSHQGRCQKQTADKGWGCHLH